MKNIQLSIPLRVKKASKVLISLFCLTAFLIMGSVSSAKAQWCPSIYNVHSYASGTGIETTGSDVGVYYQIYRNGYVWDVYREGTGDFMQWENLCQGDYTIVTWKEDCAPLTLNYGVPVSIPGSRTCPYFSSGLNLSASSPHSHEVKTNYAWFINTKNTGNWLSKS